MQFFQRRMRSGAQTPLPARRGGGGVVCFPLAGVSGGAAAGRQRFLRCASAPRLHHLPLQSLKD